MALPMRPKVQGCSSIRHASHPLTGCTDGRDVFSKLDHTEVTNTSLCLKGAAVATVTVLTRTDRCSRYISLHFRFTRTLHATQNVSYSQGTHHNGSIRIKLNRES